MMTMSTNASVETTMVWFAAAAGGEFADASLRGTIGSTGWKVGGGTRGPGRLALGVGVVASAALACGTGAE